MEGLAEQGLGAAPPSPCGKVGITGQTAADADRILDNGGCVGDAAGDGTGLCATRRTGVVVEGRGGGTAGGLRGRTLGVTGYGVAPGESALTGWQQ